MAKCGSCQQEGMTVEHIKQCYAAKYSTLTQEAPKVSPIAQRYVESKDFRPMALSLDVPASQYCLERDGELKFYRVRIGKAGTRWDGFRFVDLLIGHPGDWQKRPLKGIERKAVLEAIAANPQEAAVRFSKEFTICAVCGSPLSDQESLERGLGPICAGRF